MVSLVSQSIAVPVAQEAAPPGAREAAPQAARRAELTFEAIYAAHAPTVFRWVRRLAGPGADVEDLVQEVFFRVHRALPGFRGEAQPRTWLYRIAVRVVTRHGRVKRWLRLPIRDSATLPSSSASPEEELSAREAEGLLYRALDRLDARARALLVAFELEELSGAEIAKALGIKQPTLWVQLHRARLALQRELERLHAR
jgi:RNA polymerase sigma-70 factor (ECF subfamily)